jgi:exodeoxyribonuclease VII large subunit
MQQTLEQKTFRLKNQAIALHAISPLATMERGYSILKDASDKTIIRSVEQTSAGDTLQAHLSDGKLSVRVEKATPTKKN